MIFLDNEIKIEPCDQGFLFLAKPFFAQEHHRRFKYEAHGVELQPFLDLA